MNRWAIVLALLLSACGGGGGGSDTSTTPTTPDTPTDNSWLTFSPSSVDVQGLEGQVVSFVVGATSTKTIEDTLNVRIEAPDGDALGYITDSGIVTNAAHEALRDVRILALESNHDERMLQSGDYPYIIKRRIASSA